MTNSRTLALPAASLVVASAAGLASASTLIDVGGTPAALVADPLRPVVHVLSSEGELVELDPATASLGRRLPLGEGPQRVALEPGGPRLFLSTWPSLDITWVNRTTAAIGTIDTSNTTAIWALAIAPTGRLYASTATGIHVIDTVALSEVGFVDHGESYGPLSIGEAGGTLYAMAAASTPPYLYALDASTDLLIPFGRQAQHSSIGANGLGVLAPGHCAPLMVASGSPYEVQIFGSVPLYPRLGAIVTGPFVRSMDLSADERRLLVAGVRFLDDTFLVADVEERLVTTRVQASGEVLPGVVETMDGLFTCARVRLRPSGDFRVEIFGRAELAPNVGALRLRPIDATTGSPTSATATLVGGALLDTSSGWRDVEAAELVVAPLPPGPASITVQSGTASVVLTADVVAGQLTDLGDISLDLDTVPYLTDGGISPPIAPGETRDVEISGYDIRPGATLEGRTGLIVESYTRLGWSRMRARVTAPPDMTPGYSWAGLLVRNPGATLHLDAAVQVGTVPAHALTSDPPPAPVELLHVSKVGTSYRASWTPVTEDVLGLPEVIAAYEVVRSTQPRIMSALWKLVPATELLFDRHPAGDPLLYCYVVRARDEACATGE
jgi:hypothetical protein